MVNGNIFKINGKGLIMKKVKLEIGVKMSSNMNWVAIDEDGKMWAFENEPLPSP